MTNEGKRNLSRVEFDNTYFAIDDDIEHLISTNFGLDSEKTNQYRDYLGRKIPLLERLVQTLYIHLKMANGLYPTNKEQLEERQMHQKYAAGACYGIVTLYERIFHYIGVSRDKHIDEIKHVQKENYNETASFRKWKFIRMG